MMLPMLIIPTRHAKNVLCKYILVYTDAKGSPIYHSSVRCLARKRRVAGGRWPEGGSADVR